MVYIFNNIPPMSYGFDKKITPSTVAQQNINPEDGVRVKDLIKIEEGSPPWMNYVEVTDKKLIELLKEANKKGFQLSTSTIHHPRYGEYTPKLNEFIIKDGNGEVVTSFRVVNSGGRPCLKFWPTIRPGDENWEEDFKNLLQRKLKLDISIPAKEFMRGQKERIEIVGGFLFININGKNHPFIDLFPRSDPSKETSADNVSVTLENDIIKIKVKDKDGSIAIATIDPAKRVIKIDDSKGNREYTYDQIFKAAQ